MALLLLTMSTGTGLIITLLLRLVLDKLSFYFVLGLVENSLDVVIFSGFWCGEIYTLFLNLYNRLLIPLSFNIFAVYSNIFYFDFIYLSIEAIFFFFSLLARWAIKDLSRDSKICPKDLFKLYYLLLPFCSSYLSSS